MGIGVAETRHAVFRIAALRGSTAAIPKDAAMPHHIPPLAGLCSTWDRRHQKEKASKSLPSLFGAGDRGRTDTVSLPLDFESSTSANSITPAYNSGIIAHPKRKIKRFCKVFSKFFHNFSGSRSLGSCPFLFFVDFYGFFGSQNHNFWKKKTALTIYTKRRMLQSLPFLQKNKFFYEKW